MARGIFTLKQQLQGLQQKSWNDPIGTYAASFNGTSQYLTSSVNANLALGTSSFTVEYWLYMYKNANNPIVTFGGTGANFDAFFGYAANEGVNAQKIQWYLTSNASSWDITGGYSAIVMSGLIPINMWHHVAFVRNSNTFSMYVDGQLINSGTSSASIYQGANSVMIGNGQLTGYFPGLISNFRFVKGTALYTANFTPPSRSLTAVSGTQLLTLQNSTFVDNSSNGITFTNTGSVPLQQAYPFTQLSTPAVDYLVVAGGGSSGGSLGAGGGAGGLLQGSVPVTAGSAITVTVGAGGAQPSASTIGNNGSASVFGAISATGGGGGGQWAGGFGAAGGSGGGGNTSNGAGGNVGGQGIPGQGNAGGTVTGVYNYYAMGAGGGGAGTAGLGGPVQSSLSSAVGFNGGAGIASAILGTVYTWAGGGGGFTYGAQNETGGNGGVGGGGGGGVGGNATLTYGQGGTGYNSGTTPNAAYNGGNGGTNSGGGGGGSSVGNSGTGGTGGSGIVIVSYPDVYAAATVNTSTVIVSTSGSGSIAFSGTSQYLSTPSSSGFNFGTGDFTIEGWFNSSNVTTGELGWLQTSDTAGGLKTTYTTGVIIYFGSASNSGKIVANVGGSSYVSSTTVSANTWYHYAVTRASGVVSTWLNGVSVSSGSGNTTNLSGTYCAIGGYYSSSFVFPGYLSNVRIVKGTAVYTGAFTPSTVPLAAISGTSLLMNTVSGAQFADSSSNSLTLTATGSPTWSQSSPFATGLGYKNRVYTFNSSGTITF
jgi:hypothetical protein